MSSGRLWEARAVIPADTKIVCANLSSTQLRRTIDALSLHGLTPTVVNEDESLPDEARRYRPDAILLGAAKEAKEEAELFDTLSKLKQDAQLAAIPVLVMTDGANHVGWAEKILESGADDLIADWLPRSTLAKKLAAVVALYRQIQISHLSELGSLPLSESLPAIVYVRQPETPYAHLYVSPNVDTLGYSQDEWYRSPGIWISSIHSGDRERVLEAASAAIRQGSDHDVEYRITGKDGAVYWVNDRGRCVCDADGKVASWRGVMIDISERRRTEEALRQGEQRYRAVVDQSVVGIYLLDVRTKQVIEANRAFSNMLGYEIEETRGLSLYDLADHSKEEVDSNIDRVIANRHQYVGERRYRRKNGSIVEVEVFANLVRLDDREMLCVTCNDVTQRRAAETTLRLSEAHFRSLIENALDLITIVDQSGLMLYQSPSIERTLGYRSEYLVGKSAFDFIHPDDAPTVSQALRKVIDAPGLSESSVFRFRHSDGSWRVLEAIGKTPPDNTGIAGVVVNSRDVTERRQLEEQLIRSEKLAAMGQLVSGVAHELNNPLTSVIGFTQLMMATAALDAKSLNRLEIIRSQADRARRIVQNLLSFSRQKKPEKTEIDLNALIEKVLELRSYYMEVNNIVVVREFGEMSPALADAAQIEQVLLNIIINAEQAILGVRRGGKITIKTSVRRNDAPHRVRMVITDDGPGITPEFLGRIFDPFFTTKSVGEGTGLGLSISYGIVKEHGGLLEVTSDPAVGTTFVIELPAAAIGGALYGST